MNELELEQELEKAFRERPVVYGFFMGGGRLLSVEQAKTIIDNVSGYDQIQERCHGLCAIPGCGQPLHIGNTHYWHEHGDVCTLCHDMMDAFSTGLVQVRVWFQEMHRRWKQGLEEKAKEDEGAQNI